MTLGRKTGGKPKGYRHAWTLDKVAAREFVRQTVMRHLEPLLQAQIANAVGLKYLIVREKTSGKFLRVTEAMARVKLAPHEELVEVWEKDPNVQAFEALLNRALDKPKEQPQELNITGDAEALRLLYAGRTRAAAAKVPYVEPGALPAASDGA